MSDIQIKLEKNVTLGGVAKPKFAPKAGTASSATAVPARVEPISRVKKEYDEKRGKNNNWQNNKDKNSTNGPHVRFSRDDSGRGNGGRQGGRGGGGGGRWETPTGVAFFTGNNKQEQSAPKIHSFGVISEKTLDNKKPAVKEKATIGEDEIIDVDEEVVQDGDSSDDSDFEEGNRVSRNSPEVWPPLEYDRLAPMTLPFGPKTAAVRKRIDNEPLFAAADNHEAMTHEESNSLFLVQIPSQLKEFMCTSLSTAAKTCVACDTASAPAAAQGGHIGKIKIMKSGRVLLEASDGLTYDLSPGISTAFAQQVASITVTDSSPAAPSAPTSSGSGAAGLSGKSKKGGKAEETPAAALAVRGTMHMLGSVTRKVVICPNYAIGRLRESTEESSSAAASTTASSSAAAQEGSSGSAAVYMARSSTLESVYSETGTGIISRSEYDALIQTNAEDSLFES